MFSKLFSENRAVYEKMSTTMVEPERPQAIWRLDVCWISKATRAQAHARAPTHTYVILIAFPRQQWFRERA